MAEESKKWYAATVILHLVSFGVVAAGITISFGSICFLALTTSRETLVGSYIGKARTDVDYSCCNCSLGWLRYRSAPWM